MVASDFRDKYAIVGVGMTPTSRTHAPGMSGMLLEAWAARLAMEDAGLGREDIDGAVHTIFASPHPPGSVWGDGYTRKLGLKPNFYITVARGGQTAHNGLLLATQALATGNANYVVVSCGANGWSTSHTVTEGRRGGIMGTLTGAGGPGGGTEMNNGLGFLGYNAVGNGGSTHGYYASRHMHEYGTTHEQLGAVALAARAWAQLNPEARFYGRPATMEDYLASPWIIHPLRRMDCCLVSDLGCAVIVTTAERARTLRHKPVFIKGIGLGDGARQTWWDKTNYIQTDAAHAKRKAFEGAGVSMADVDVAEFYDCFTTEIIFYMEDYGLVKKGEGGPFVASGAIAPGGSFPVNTHGGLLSGMYLFDWPSAVEAVRQMRGAAGQRQIKGAEIALTNGHGGEYVLPGMAASHATMVLGNVLS